MTKVEKLLDKIYKIHCLAGSKIIFTNGSQDPWRHASKQISSSDSKFLIALFGT